VQVDFSKNAYCDNEVECPDYSYKNGILFINLGASKGEILKKFFDKTGKNPNKIIFIDNNKKNIVAMGDMCKREKLSFVGVIPFSYINFNKNTSPSTPRLTRGEREK
jgi:hypothetical protein